MIPKTKERIYAEELLINKELTHTEIAKLIHKKYKRLPVETIRATVRRASGNHGQIGREKGKLNPENIREKNFKILFPKEYSDAKKRKLTKSKYYIITSAQNNTSLHRDFWDNIKAYSKFLNAEIHVILNRYKNPTSVFTDALSEKWDSEILPYSDAKRHHIHKHLVLMSDIKIQPTASLPLTGMEGLSGLNSCIFGHPKVQFKVIPALEGYEPKMMFTTGSVTKANYTDSKAGKKGEFHHTFGFCIVEIKDNDTFFIRQVTALQNGSFTDLCYNIKYSKVTKINRIDVAVLGDIHVGDDCKVVNAQQRKWLNYFKPKHTVLHDIFNGHSINHHEEKDPIKQYRRELDGSNDLSREINDMNAWLKSMLKYNLVLASSNHTDWLDRYIRSNDWKKNIKNALIYVECAKIALSGKAPKGLIGYFVSKEFGDKVKVIGRDESFKFNEWELAQHGDVGGNGSKGSISQYRRLSTKLICGHSHSPSRQDGLLYVGTSTKLRVGFNVGASSWLNCDVIVHKDRKAQHIIYQGEEKEFTTFKF